jgi:predicted SnoaL-like aldol condensation-catalyzing enzyme
MNLRDPKLTALLFNECVSNRDITGISKLMTKDHVFIDRKGDSFEDMVNGWMEFFQNFPTYKNYFSRVESQGDLVILIGYAIWSKNSSERDHAIWTATIENDLVKEWHIYEDTHKNREKLNII